MVASRRSGSQPQQHLALQGRLEKARKNYRKLEKLNNHFAHVIKICGFERMKGYAR